MTRQMQPDWLACGGRVSPALPFTIGPVTLASI